MSYATFQHLPNQQDGTAGRGQIWQILCCVRARAKMRSIHSQPSPYVHSKATNGRKRTVREANLKEPQKPSLQTCVRELKKISVYYGINILG